ncbi:hypothetical protein D5S18_00850 [Nocardia panacis]|uniref:DUF2694 domain-containing protein n=1 Tax=Nocardia panacis TaxID=2340916 RepID=A0A3A4KTZ2_9NOCA|nr:hypothetical protein [Nocardia panacis]RJO79856.1 hypothetical protein D5S18_00850 [Nocardia panacis]
MNDWDDDATAAPDWNRMVYETLNPDNSVGVACSRSGEIVGMHIAEEARDNGDAWLSAEILRVAKLAHMKSRVGLRAEMAYQGAETSTIDAFDLPTEVAYRNAEREAFRETRS